MIINVGTPKKRLIKSVSIERKLTKYLQINMCEYVNIYEYMQIYVKGNKLTVRM